MGTGLTQLATAGVVGNPGRVVALVSHLHFDHVQGLPFFSPVHETDTSIDIYGPMQEAGSLHEVAAELLNRAAGLRPETRGVFVGALSSLGLDVRELVALAGSVDVSRRPDAIRLLWMDA